MSSNIQDVARKLSDLSVKTYYCPYSSIIFPETISENEIESNWFVTPELISIYGQPEYEAMTEQQKKRLSFFETINFFSLNIHGEKSLMEGIAQRLYSNRSREETRYLHHFLDEENKHMVYFGTFCSRYAGKVYADRKMVFPREYALGEEELLFFLKVFIFEEIVDSYNLTTARDERVHQLARDIHLAHHKDEVRHLAYGRVAIQNLAAEYMPKWNQETLENFHEYIEGYIQATWREYYNPDVYKDAGLPDPYDLASNAFDSEVARVHRTQITRSCIDFLLKNGILVKEPGL